MGTDREYDRRITEEAAGWLTEFDSGGSIDSTLAEAFLTWLKQSPLHVKEILILDDQTKLMTELMRESDYYKSLTALTMARLARSQVVCRLDDYRSVPNRRLGESSQSPSDRFPTLQADSTEDSDQD
jgi:ferric-dicitrate binding protein FerR (iron transport regulator)